MSRVGLYFLATFTLIVASVDALEIENVEFDTATMVLLASLIVTVVILRHEARRNRTMFHKYAAGLAGIGSVITVASFSVGLWRGPSAIVAMAAAIGASVWAITSIVRGLRAKDTVPDVLRARFSEASISELDGVQVVVQQEATASGVVVTTFVQNCWSASRAVRLSFDVTRPLFGGTRGECHVPALDVVELGPGEVRACTIPVTPAPDARGEFHLWVRLKVSGSGGDRVRHREARAFTDRIPLWLTLLLTPFGLVAFGGGTRVIVRASGESRPPAEPTPAAWKSIFAPASST